MAKTRSATKKEAHQRFKNGAKVKKHAKADRKPLTRRRASSSVPKLGSHVIFLIVFPTTGGPTTLKTIHTSLLPASTLAVLNDTAAPFYNVQDDPEIVDIWREFLYSGRLCIKQEVEEEEWGWIADCYVLGLFLKDERFCNVVIDAMIDKQFETGSYPNNLASFVFTETERGDCLRKLIVDLHVWAGQGVITKGSEDDACSIYAFRNAVSSHAWANASKLRDHAIEYPWADACKYHSHTTTRRCGGRT